MTTKDIPTNIPLELIDDNPFNPRAHYAPGKVKEMAQSLREVGLLQVPEGRPVDGRIQIAYGHMRKRGFLHNQKKDGENWKTMPLHVSEISDEDMFHFAMEENLTRTDITPIEVARSIETFCRMFPDVLDEDIAKKHNMTAANVSNMKRVLRLPEKFLEKIDDGRLSFTQGRELLTLEELPDAETLMSSAVSGVRSGNRQWGHANTVEGLQKSIHETVQGTFRPLDKKWESYRWDILFDTREAGCLKCSKMIRTHPTKSEAAHYCLDEECWVRHDTEHRDAAAAGAKAKMEAAVLKLAMATLPDPEPEPAPCEKHSYNKQALCDFCGWPEPKYTLEKRGTSWIALDAQGVVIAVETLQEEAANSALAYCSPVATKINPAYADYSLNHTYRFIQKPGSRKLDYFDITAQDLATAAKALGVDPENIERVKVWKSSGKPGTGGGVSAGWSKCTESLDNISQEMSAKWRCGKCNVYFEFSPPGDESKALVECPNCRYEYVTYRRADKVLFCLPAHNYGELPAPKIPSTGGETDPSLIAAEEQLEKQADEADQQREEARERANLERPAGELPCETCANGSTCDRATFHVADVDDSADRLVCESWQPSVLDQLDKAKAAAGTRAELLDLKDISAGPSYSGDMRQGYTLLDRENILDPEECQERCTHGFHFAFDSRRPEGEERTVCSDSKCLAKKKAAFTRAKNAAGQARKKAEVRAVKQAVAESLAITRKHLKVILLAQIEGKHIERSYYGGDEVKKPLKWLWDKVSAGTADHERTTHKLFKAIDKLTDEDLASLVMDMMFYYLLDHGDLGRYQIKTEVPLGWLGMKIELEQEEKDGEEKGNRGAIPAGAGRA